MSYPLVLSASSLSTNTVKNMQDENLGHVKDIMIDTLTNRVVYYVLSFGGILGMGDKLFAIPPEALRLNATQKCYTLNIEKERLKEAEGFDKDNWPNMADPTFRSNLYLHYGLPDRFAA